MDWLQIENRHTGEKLKLRRVARDGVVSLELSGTLPPKRKGPPLHIHHAQVEEGTVVSGTISFILDGKVSTAATGAAARFPAGSVHRWWNGGDDELVFAGTASPAVDLDRYLHSVFDVLNAGTAERPPLFYMAHVAWRHRKTQEVILAPRPVQAVMLPLIVFVGTILGRYRGDDWPGAPGRAREAPLFVP
ncbi:MAG TPA: cupin domain-containing protein [Candidatus Polarisedimenticolaceae bacterium]|nr:cupin domain-containing protein [Candidatus Polarisedimenticolaceae bacterium]